MRRPPLRKEIHRHKDCAGINFAVLAEKPWRLESVLKLVIAIIVFMIFAGLVAGILKGFSSGLSDIVPVIAAALIFEISALFLINCFLRMQITSWSEAFGFDIQPTRALLTGLVVTLIFFPAGLLLQAASGELMTRIGHEPVEQEAVQAMRETGNLIGSVGLGLVAILLAPVVEEMLFRGLLYPAIKQKGFPRAALWISSIAFAVIHFNVAIFLPLTILAMVLTWLYEKTENLLAPIAAHALFNSISFIALTIQKTHGGQ